jgi:hypothetical protein
MPDEAEDSIAEFEQHNIEALVVRTIKELRIELGSCLDVGCGKRPVREWFLRIARGPDCRFLATEVDPEIIEVLRAQGVTVVNPSNTELDLTSDLVLAKEVIEHVDPAESEEFLAFCARHTAKLFALTTPNFEYWPRLKAVDPELRWVPDHFGDFKPTSKDPHDHRQEMTPEVLVRQFSKAFPSDRWRWRVYRAWPWRISDVARKREWTLYFKVFAIAWRSDSQLR